MRNLLAIAGILVLVAACGDDPTSSGYWQDPRDDLKFEGWEQPEEKVEQNLVSEVCAAACGEVEYCYDMHAQQRMQDFVFPLVQGKCVAACSQGLLTDAVWTCLADITFKLVDGEPSDTYCAMHKELCFKPQ